MLHTIALFGRRIASQKRIAAEIFSRKSQELTEAGTKLSDTQKKLSESEKQHRECQQALESKTKKFVKLGRSYREELQKADESLDRELTKIEDRMAAQEGKVTELEGRMAEEVTSKNIEIGELEKEVAIWKDKNTQSKNALSQEVAEKMEAHGFIKDNHGFTQLVSRPFSPWLSAIC